MQFETGNFDGSAVAVGAGIGIGAASIVGAIISIIQANQQMEELERRMAEFVDPGLIYQPVRREFILAQLEMIGEYLFKQLPTEIETMRKINIDLFEIGTGSFDVFYAIKERIMLAGEGLRDDAKGKAFAELVDQPLPQGEVFNAAQSPLHQPLPKIDVMRKQHDWLTKKTRGKVYGGDYTPHESQQREASAAGMWLELSEGKKVIEDIAHDLSRENQQLSDLIAYTKANFRNLIALYEIAVLAYAPNADEKQRVDSAHLFNRLFGLIEADEDNGFDKALSAVSELMSKSSQKETHPA